MRRILSICAALLALPLAAQVTPGRLAQDIFLATDVYHTYDYTPSAQTRPPRGYKAVYVSHYGRHGERYINRAAYLMPGFNVLKNEELTPAGEKALGLVEDMIQRCEDHWGALSPRGAESHRQIATRLFHRH